MAEFRHVEVLNPGKDTTTYRLLSKAYVQLEKVGERNLLRVDPQALTLLAQEAIRDVSHLFRTSHLQQLAQILKDPEASDNDRYVATEMLKNASVSAGMVLPSCQDTGTATILAKKGEQVWTGGGDREALSRGVFRIYHDTNLRYSQVAPITLFDEKNTGTNLPAQIDIEAVDGESYKFMFVVKGGGSANKTFLYQETKALLNPERFRSFITEKVKSLGTSACPPYHLAIVVGGSSPEMNLKTVKLASTRYLDGLPTRGSGLGEGIRDLEWEQEVHKITQQLGIGAQFGGKYFAHDVRIIRLPRHGASCPVGIGVSCSADRQILGKIDKEGVWLEDLDRDPARFLPEISGTELTEEVVHLDLNRSMAEIRAELTRYPIKTRFMLTGPIVVARDIAHAKINERLDAGEGMPEYLKNHIVYYAGPAKTPEGYASGSFGPTTAGRMDSYVDRFQKEGGSLVMLAKGNRSPQVTEACRSNGGFYLGSIGGVAAQLAKESIRKVEIIDYPELGMEAVYRIEVENFPAFIIVDDKGNDFFTP
ncbi:fumarase [Magnetococcus marinus MC-1]|uniref:Fumarate hydratase class I n=1 Tax=Magnetococcus marinus (strain ATCC BAA-1437 / JCM 17883 / MC-1) TaxID=156889 RepID=A0LCN5_MAGMM|nr:fumarate hydratase [Magnetococcus marinus]ABK45728.1 fumarase [Magnetococcus marinus MC-1]